MNEACGLLPPPFSSCIPRALASTLFPLPSPTTPFPAVSSLSRSPSLSPLATLSPTTQLGVYLMCVCICAFFPPSQCIAAANNVAMYVYPSSFVSLDVPPLHAARSHRYIYRYYTRDSCYVATHGSAGRRIKSAADRSFPAWLIRSKRFSNRRRICNRYPRVVRSKFGQRRIYI